MQQVAQEVLCAILQTEIETSPFRFHEYYR